MIAGYSDRRSKAVAVEFNDSKGKGEDYDYNPYEHRVVAHPTT